MFNTFKEKCSDSELVLFFYYYLFCLAMYHNEPGKSSCKLLVSNWHQCLLLFVLNSAQNAFTRFNVSFVSQLRQQNTRSSRVVNGICKNKRYDCKKVVSLGISIPSLNKQEIKVLGRWCVAKYLLACTFLLIKYSDGYN